MDDFFSFQHEESSANSGISTLKVAIQPSGDRQVSLVNAFTAGSLSGTCSTLLFQPFDLVKTCLQVEGTALSSTGWPKLGGSNAMLYSFYSVIGREALLRCVPGIGLYFSALRGLSQFTSEERTLGESVLLGASGRTIAGITLLLETIVKTRHESGFYSYNSMLDAVMPIWKREGGKGLYSGLLATAARDAPFSGFYLMFYTKIKRQAKNGLGTPELHAFETFICGSLAGVIASVVTQPADVVKTKLQLFPHKYSSTGSAVYCILKDSDDVDYVCTHPEIVRVPDPEILLDNLVELKHHKLVRSIRRGTVSRELKPNAKTRDQLDQIVGYPSTKVLTSEEEDLVWQFQFYLTNQKKALTKFLKCVDWTQPQEARQAQELLEEWNPVDVEDALELLSSQFTNRAVRQYAVSRLKDANDDDLLLYLLQLVQALRYEALSDEEEKLTENTVDSLLQDNTESQTAETIPTRDAEGIAMVKDIEEGSDLASFLILRACRSDTLANYFYWYLFVECNKGKDTKAAEMFSNVMKRFSQALMKGGWECTVRQNMLGKQQQFVNHIVRLMKEVSQFRGGHNKKIHRLRDLLDVPELTSFEPIPLLLDPEIKIKGIIVGTPEDKKVWLFKSHLMPCKLTFLTLDDREYVTIFKNGDDLRQDELILQIIRLMDKLLMKENLDLKLTPYKVLATSGSHGFVQFIESTPIAEILHKDEDRSILNYFRRHAPCESAPLGISPEVMDTYVKSCAGYCVITYILGVGDRHLDNLLLTKSGNLFHIDFGYILGEDPKPLPPPMKLNKEMVEGMGGASSEFYQTFREQCFKAFLLLRRHANLILNLFSLMVDANIPHIALEPDKAVKKVQDKFRLDLSDEEAVQYLQSLIDESVTAMFPVVVEHIHKFAQYWRK